MVKIDESDAREFVSEADELLEAAEAELLKAERGQYGGFYDAVFRAFHSIKGGAGMLGLEEVQSHMHKVENLWSSLKGRGSLEKSEAEYFLRAIDGGRKLLRGQTISFDYAGPKVSGTKTQNEKNVSAPATGEKASNSLVASSPGGSVGTPKSVDEDQNLTSRPKYMIYAVDDEEVILELLQDILVEEGFDVRCFTDGDAMIAAAKEKAPHIVLTDYKMPGKSGLDVLHDINQLFPEVPVVMLSGYITKDILISSLRDGGFYGVLEKPFAHTDLLRQVLAACRHFDSKRMLRRSLNLLVYQFADLEKFLVSQGKLDVAKSIASEVKELLKLSKTPPRQN